MKNIYIITENNNAAAYGIKTYIKEVCSFFIAVGYKTNIIEFGGHLDEFQIVEANDITQYIFPKYHNKQFKRYYKAIAEILRLHITDSMSNVFQLNFTETPSLIEALKSSFPLSKTLLTIHYMTWMWELKGDYILFKKIISSIQDDYIKEKYSEIIRFHEIDLKIYDKIDHIVVLSAESYDILHNIYHIPDEKLHFIPNGKENVVCAYSAKQKNDILKKIHLSEEDRVLLFVGRLDEMKGLKVLISSLKNIINDYPLCKLIVVGGAGNPAQFMEYTENIAKRIIFTGKLTQDTLRDYYQIAEVGVIPSYAEQCSYVGIEMLMHGLPVVASDGIGLRSMFKDMENSKVARIENYDDDTIFITNLTQALTQVLMSNELRDELRCKASITYNENYTIERMKESYLEVIDKM